MLLPEIHEALLSTENVRNGHPIVLPYDKEFSKMVESVFVVCSDTAEGLLFSTFCAFFLNFQ